MNSQIFQYMAMVVPILLSLTVHEYSHGYVAWRLGDPTAKNMGRLTLNPVSHIDPIGMLMLFIVGMGWAKPVPININAFNNPKRDMAVSSAAGPLSNFIMAAFIGLIYRLAPQLQPLQADAGVTLFLKLNLFYFLFINVGLGVFNLIPIPPLDGSKILRGFLPDSKVYIIDYLERYGVFLILGIFLIGRLAGFSIFSRFLGPLISGLIRFFSGINV
ncbi:MAG: site-2 protease family protein [Candidatus Marinimicrobia bacterium]|nr:site-2 protease family protein [Candidatus Neomarinimicrobiota bacterium]